MKINQLIKSIQENQNIEVVYKNLWSVNFDYLKNGWIEGITIDNINENDFLTVIRYANSCYTIVILNKNHKNYKRILPVFKFIMKLRIKDLKSRTSFYRYFRFYFKKYENYSNKQIDYLLKSYDLSKAKDFYDQTCLFEIQRRKEERLRRKQGR